MNDRVGLDCQEAATLVHNTSYLGWSVQPFIIRARAEIPDRLVFYNPITHTGKPKRNKLKSKQQRLSRRRNR